MSVTQSLTSEVKTLINHKCRCQICVCNNPNHKCPINHQKVVDHTTTFQHEFPGHDAKKPDLWGARDNLKFKKQKDRGPTEYQAEYTKKKIDLEKMKTDDIYKNMTVDINMGSHLKNTLGNAKDIDLPNYNDKYYKDNPRLYRPKKYGPNGEPIERPRTAPKHSSNPNDYGHKPDGEHYYQPKKWNHPKTKKQIFEMKERTQYQKDYEKPKEGLYPNPGKLVHDNLVTGVDPLKDKEKTHYQHHFGPKDGQ